jgi:flavin-dependent dehydrogenase
MSRRTVKVAVIGSGLAGLTAAYLLSITKSEKGDVIFEVHLFEKVLYARLTFPDISTYPMQLQALAFGIDAYSVSVPVPGEMDGSKHKPEWRIDVPMRSFQGGTFRHISSAAIIIAIKRSWIWCSNFVSRLLSSVDCSL